MKRPQRNRRIRSAAFLVLAFFFALWVASFSTAIARFSTNSELLFGNGELFFRSSSEALYSYDTLLANCPYSMISAGLTRSDNQTVPYQLLYKVKTPFPHWDATVVDFTLLRDWPFWSNRSYGFRKPTFTNTTTVIPVHSVYMPVPCTEIRIPMGSLFFVSLLLVGVIIMRTRAFAPGHCQQCNYDLYKKASNTCPECGTLVPADLRNLRKAATGKTP